jgi:transposase
VACHQEKARRQGRTVVLIDESGFMLQPVVRRTWAVRGMTPMLRRSERHDRLTAIGALSPSPERRRAGLYFRLDRQNATSESVMKFVALLRRQLQRPLTIVWDRLNVHRSVARDGAKRLGEDVLFEFLPPYAPQLNPVEQVWSHSKYGEMSNYVPSDIDELRSEVTKSLQSKRTNQEMLKTFFRHAGLSPE